MAVVKFYHLVVLKIVDNFVDESDVTFNMSVWKL